MTKKIKNGVSSTSSSAVKSKVKKNSKKKTSKVNGGAKSCAQIEKFFDEKINEDQVFHKAR